MSEDPIGFAGGDVNLYRYVGNNPVSFTDPRGLESPIDGGAFAGVGFTSRTKRRMDNTFEWLQRHHPELTKGINPDWIWYMPLPNSLLDGIALPGLPIIIAAADMDNATLVEFMAHELMHKQEKLKSLFEPGYHDDIYMKAYKIKVEYRNSNDNCK